jgi:hypothetical protein
MSTCVLICLVLLIDGFTSLIFIYKVFIIICLTGREVLSRYLQRKKNPCREVLVKYKEKKSKYYFRFEKRLIETFLSKALYYLQ